MARRGAEQILGGYPGAGVVLASRSGGDPEAVPFDRLLLAAAGVEACERSFELAQDPVSAAYASGQLGFALVQAGDPARAIPVLQEAINQFGQFRPGCKLTQARFQAWLGEAQLAAGDLVTAERSGRQSIDNATAVEHRFAIGVAERVLGQVEDARGAPQTAGRHLEESLRIFAELPAPLEEARTRLALAQLADRSGRSDEAARQREAAARTLRDLGAAAYLERAGGAGPSPEDSHPSLCGG